MNSTVQQPSATAPLRKNILQECNFRASPTDLLMTPCTAKLHAHKQMRYSKAKGKVLQFGLPSSRLAATSRKEDSENEEPQQ